MIVAPPTNDQLQRQITRKVEDLVGAMDTQQEAVNSLLQALQEYLQFLQKQVEDR